MPFHANRDIQEQSARIMAPATQQEVLTSDEIPQRSMAAHWGSAKGSLLKTRWCSGQGRSGNLEIIPGGCHVFLG
jgi:hypothetical protein